MRKKKYTYKDVHVGDMVHTYGGVDGQVIAIKSYSYINHKIYMKS